MLPRVVRCPLAIMLLALCVAPSRAEDERPRVLFLIGEQEYNTKETLPAFADAELTPRGVECVFVHVDPDDPDNFPGIEQLADADLLFLSVRRRTLPASQLAVVRDYLDAGRPMVGIRTASHPFDRRQPPAEGKADWVLFDDEVLGMDYQGHYSNKPPGDPPTLVMPVAAELKHPVMRGIGGAEFPVTSHLYKNRDAAPTVTILMTGRIKDRGVFEPVAWTNTYHGGRIFYTSLGSPADFEIPQFRTMLTNAVMWGLGRELTRASER
ncbi:MAG: ThuA domain-containing protein [Pirellulales bacterium]